MVWVVRIESQPCGMMRIIKRWESLGTAKESDSDGAAVPLPVLGAVAPPLTEPQNFKESLKPGYGALPGEKKFTPAMTGKVLNVGACFEMLYPTPSQSCFCTLTLPGDTDEANEALSRYSGWLVNRILQYIRDNYGDFDYFYKWEYQKRGALHLHICLGFTDSLETSNFVTQWKTLAHTLLEQICKLSGIDLFQRIGKNRVTYDIYQADSQIVKKSVSRYLSKYASKPDKKSGFKAYSRRIRIYYPSRFSGNSRRLARMVRSLTYSLKVVLTGSYQRKMLEEVLHYVESFCRLAKVFKHEYGDGDTRIYYGEGDDRMELLLEITRIPYDWNAESRCAIDRIYRAKVIDSDGRNVLCDSLGVPV